MLFNDMFSLLNYVKLKVLGLKLKKLFFYNKKKLVFAHPSTLHSRIFALSSYFDQHCWNFTPG